MLKIEIGFTPCHNLFGWLDSALSLAIVDLVVTYHPPRALYLSRELLVTNRRNIRAGLATRTRGAAPALSCAACLG